MLEDSGEESDDIVAYDMETSRYMTVTNRDRQEKRDRHWVNHQHKKEQCHDPCHCQKKLNLPIFRDSTSDNAITYNDWRCDVDNCIREEHSTTLIRDSVLSALEGRPCCTAMTAMEDGNGSLKSIMTALDQVYGGATTYTALLHKLNSIQQAHGELAKDYYLSTCADQVQTPGIPPLHVQTWRSGVPGQGSLLQQIASRVPVNGSAQEGQPQCEYHEIACHHEGMRGESGE